MISKCHNTWVWTSIYKESRTRWPESLSNSSSVAMDDLKLEHARFEIPKRVSILTYSEGDTNRLENHLDEKLALLTEVAHESIREWLIEYANDIGSYLSKGCLPLLIFVSCCFDIGRRNGEKPLVQW